MLFCTSLQLKFTQGQERLLRVDCRSLTNSVQYVAVMGVTLLLLYRISMTSADTGDAVHFGHLVCSSSTTDTRLL